MHYTLPLPVNTVSLHTLDNAFRELGLGREQTNEVLQVVEVESILSKVFQPAHKDDLSGFNKSLVCLEQYQFNDNTDNHVIFLKATRVGRWESWEESGT